jgi:hypothetical protein
MSPSSSLRVPPTLGVPAEDELPGDDVPVVPPVDCVDDEHADTPTTASAAKPAIQRILLPTASLPFICFAADRMIEYTLRLQPIVTRYGAFGKLSSGGRGSSLPPEARMDALVDVHGQQQGRDLDGVEAHNVLMQGPGPFRG